jgi:hypothetical protein
VGVEYVGMESINQSLGTLNPDPLPVLAYHSKMDPARESAQRDCATIVAPESCSSTWSWTGDIIGGVIDGLSTVTDLVDCFDI